MVASQRQVHPRNRKTEKLAHLAFCAEPGFARHGTRKRRPPEAADAGYSWGFALSCGVSKVQAHVLYAAWCSFAGMEGHASGSEWRHRACPLCLRKTGLRQSSPHSFCVHSCRAAQACAFRSMCVQVTFAQQGGGANAARRARVITPLYDVSSSCYADAQATLSQRPRPSQIRLRVGLRRRCWLNWQPTIARALRLGNRLRSKRHAIVISNRAVRWSERCGDACC